MAGNTKGVVAQSVGILCLIEVRKGEPVLASTRKTRVKTWHSLCINKLTIFDDAPTAVHASSG
jgi:hypothetical protein